MGFYSVIGERYSYRCVDYSCRADDGCDDPVMLHAGDYFLVLLMVWNLCQGNTEIHAIIYTEHRTRNPLKLFVQI